MTPMTPEQICKMAAKGDPRAEDFCLAWVRFAHVLDDLVDRDKPVNAETIGFIFSSFITELCGNPFFLGNKPVLFGLMIQAANCWLDSSVNGAYTTEERAERDVLKGFYHEVIFHVAFICGGWQHLRHVTSECRSYDFEETD